MRALVRILAAALPLLIACSLLSAGPATITPVAGTPTAAAIATEPPPAVSGEAIQILEPGPGSRLVSPLSVRVRTRLPAFEANRVRRQPNNQSVVLGFLQPGEKMEILDGPVCYNNWIWWQVRSLESDLSGWTVEGDSTSYWLVPY